MVDRLPFLARRCRDAGVAGLARRLARFVAAAAARDRPHLLGQGLCLFCLNFMCFLYASPWIASGLVAVCFSTAPVWNALNGRVFQGKALSARVNLGAGLGLAGLLLLFGGALLKDLGRAQTLRGLGLALAGTYCFSLGNLLSGAMQRLGHAPIRNNAWAMTIGVTVIAAWAPTAWRIARCCSRSSR